MLSKLQKMGIICGVNAAFLALFYFVTVRVLEHFAGFVFIYLGWDLLLLAVFSVTFLALGWNSLYANGYHYYLKRTTSIVTMNLVLAAAVAFVFCSVAELLFNPEYTAEGYAFLAIGVGAFLLFHFFQYLWMKSLSRLGFFMRNVLVVGTPDPRVSIDAMFQDVGNTKKHVGRLSYRDGVWVYHKGKADEAVGNGVYTPDIFTLMYRLNVGELVIFMGSGLNEDDLVEIVEFCRAMSIGYYLVPDLRALPNRTPWNRPFSYVPILERFSTPRDSLTLISIKRLMDIMISVMAMFVIVPVGLVVAALIKLEDRGPVFYVSTRIGKNGKPIKFYKFRSMVVDADKKKAELLAYNERKDGPLFKMRNDPRITRIGRIIRKYSLDELPQFLNVLKGDMSLVGPRPHLPSEVEEYGDKDYLRLECIPGVTCLPQIYGRSSLSFREWVDFDLEYRRNWSISLDLKIISKTVSVLLEPVLSGRSESY